MLNCHIALMSDTPTVKNAELAAAAPAIPGITFHPGHHGAHHRQVDLVVTTLQHLIGVRQCGLTMHAGSWPGGHRFVRIAGQRAATAFRRRLPMRGPIRLAFSGWFGSCPFDGGRLK